MKTFAVLFLCTLALVAVKAHFTAEEKDAFRGFAQTCKGESGATDDDIEGIIMHKPAASKEAKCLRACLMKQVDVLNADGKLVKDSTLKVAELRTKGDATKMAIVDEVSGICKDTSVSDDHCEAAEQYAQCFMEESSKRGIVAVEF